VDELEVVEVLAVREVVPVAEEALAVVVVDAVAAVVAPVVPVVEEALAVVVVDAVDAAAPVVPVVAVEILAGIIQLMVGTGEVRQSCCTILFGNVPNEANPPIEKTEQLVDPIGTSTSH